MRKVNDPKLEYIRNIFAREFDDLNSIEFPDEKPGMQIGAEEGKLLFLLIKMQNAKNILEIGTFFGYSAAWMAKALPEDGKVFTIEKNSYYSQSAQINFNNLKLNKKIDILQGEALQILPTLNQQFDMIFIDGAKSEYLNYLSFTEKLLKKNGILVADNALLFDTVFDDSMDCKKVTKKTIQNMQAFNLRINDLKKFQSIMIPTASGMTISLKIF